MLWLKELYFEIYLLFYEVTAPANSSIDSLLCGLTRLWHISGQSGQSFYELAYIKGALAK